MKELMRFQVEKKLHTKDYVYMNECTNIVEEMLEVGGFKVPKENRPQLRDAWVKFVGELLLDKVAIADGDFDDDEDAIDGYADIITFCVGAIMKKGYNPLIVIEECGKEINSRVGEFIDGKFVKTSTNYIANYGKADLR